MRLLIAAVLSTLLAACGSPVPTTPSSPSSSPTPAGPGDARLTLTAGGQVACGIPYGCSALLLIQPDGGETSPSPVWTVTTGQPVSFPLVGASRMGTWDVGSFAADAPARIAPGRYQVAGVINLVSDVASPVTTPVPLKLVPTCVAGLTVAAGSSVKVSVTFAAAGTCKIKIATPSDGPTA